MNNAASIKARLRNLAAKEHKPYDYVQTHYMIERLLYRLSISKYADDFVLKGGLLLHVLFTEKARATRDIDFLARFTSNSPENLKAIFTNVCAIKADDAVVFDPNTLTAEAITEGADYHGVRMKLTGFLERSRSVLQFDLGFGDVSVPHPERMDSSFASSGSSPLRAALDSETMRPYIFAAGSISRSARPVM